MFGNDNDDSKMDNINSPAITEHFPGTRHCQGVRWSHLIPAKTWLSLSLPLWPEQVIQPPRLELLVRKMQRTATPCRVVVRAVVTMGTSTDNHVSNKKKKWNYPWLSSSLLIIHLFRKKTALWGTSFSGTMDKVRWQSPQGDKSTDPYAGKRLTANAAVTWAMFLQVTPHLDSQQWTG